VAPERHIVAIGGAGFARESEPILRLLLELTGAERPRVCFLPTASGDSREYTVRFYDAVTRLECAPSHVELHGTPEREAVRDHLLAQDAIYVGGGNTANMLVVWRLHGVDEVLREAWERGIVLSGTSAGANCWFEACTTDSFGPIAPLRDGLGFLPGSFSPHYHAEPERRPTYLRLVGEGFPSGYAADDGAALRFAGTELAEVVTTGDGRAYRVERGTDGRAIEMPLDPRRLG
jgi:peptidase E